MKNLDKIIEVRAKEILKVRRIKFILDFIKYVIDKFPFRIHTVKTERRHDFQAQFHWHIEDKGIRHVCIKPSSS